MMLWHLLDFLVINLFLFVKPQNKITDSIYQQRIKGLYSDSYTQKHAIEQKKIKIDCFCQKQILSVCFSSHKN